MNSEKAYDIVNRKALWEVLSQYGLHGTFEYWSELLKEKPSLCVSGGTNELSDINEGAVIILTAQKS